MKIKVFLNDCLKEEMVVEGFFNSIKIDDNDFHIFMIGGEAGKLLEPYDIKNIELEDGKVLSIKISQSKIFSDAIEIIKKFKGMKSCEIEIGSTLVEVEY